MNSQDTHIKILVGVDGSTSSFAALKWATALAAQRNGSVTAVMTWNYPAALLIPALGGPGVPAADLFETSTDKLAAIVAASPRPELITDQRVVMGTARSVLCDATEDHDLLVLGRTGSGKLVQLLVGSTAAHCVRHSECPVVVVRESASPEETITVAVDGSPSSIDALVWALSFDNAQIVAAYSHDEWELDDLPLDNHLRGDLAAHAEQMLADATATALERTGANPKRVLCQVMQGDPRTTLVKQADPSTMLVLGAQGHSGFARWALGSLADYAVQHAPGSVAICR